MPTTGSTLLGSASANAGVNQRAIDAVRQVRGEAFDLPLEITRFWKHNQIVWAGPERLPAALERLVGALQLELYRAEFILERRTFAAHVTLVRKASAPEALPDLPRVDWPVQELLLMQSELAPTGASYKVSARFPLR